MKLIQGLQVCAKRRGLGFVLHKAMGDSVREQALELARKKYYAEGRKRNLPKAQRFTKESVGVALDEIVDSRQQVTSTGEEVSVTVNYLVGWTIVNDNQVGGGHKNFPPVTAIDCANMRGRALGVLVARGVKNANRKLNFASLSRMLAAEGDLSVGAHMAAEKACLHAAAFNSDEDLTIYDGGSSLRKKTIQFNENSGRLRCTRHLDEELVKGGKAGADSREIYAKLVAVPKNHAKAAEQLYSKLPANSPLLKVPKDELCPAFLPEVIQASHLN